MLEADETIRAVEVALGHRFAEFELLVDALTHSSFVNERPDLARTDNDRLEFLGDAVLQWAVSALIVELFPTGTAGEMTRRRAELVCEDGLFEVAQHLGIGPGLRLGRGESRTGGRTKPRLLSSALEACVAAVYLDGGSEAAMNLCRRLFGERARAGTAGARDYKTRLQESLQQQGKRLPRYEVATQTGPEHARRFEVALVVDGEEVARGSGRTKVEAEQTAAEQGLRTLEARAGREADTPEPFGD